MQYKISVNKLLDSVRLILLGLMLFYILCFQYAFHQISGALVVLGGLLLGLEVLRFRSFSYYIGIVYVLLFVLLSFVVGLVCSFDVKVHISTAADMLQLCLPMISICGYVGRSEGRLRKVLHMISASVLTLAIMLFIKGEQFSYYGSLTVGDLNTNGFSSFLLLGLLAQLFLLSSSDTKPLTKRLLIISIIAELIAQLLVASRRGVVVFTLMLVAYLHTLVFIHYKKKPIYKLVTILLILCGGIVFLASFSNIAEDFVVFQRLLGQFTVGDERRRAVQQVAKELFWENPLFGRGLGSVGVVAGVYSHSLYYETLACTGVFGFFLLLLPVLTMFIKFFSRSVSMGDVAAKAKHRTMAWGIVALLLSGVAVVFIYDASFYIILGVFGAFLNISETITYAEVP